MNKQEIERRRRRGGEESREEAKSAATTTLFGGSVRFRPIAPLYSIVAMSSTSARTVLLCYTRYYATYPYSFCASSYCVHIIEMKTLSRMNALTKMNAAVVILPDVINRYATDTSSPSPQPISGRGTGEGQARDRRGTGRMCMSDGGPCIAHHVSSHGHRRVRPPFQPFQTFPGRNI